MTSMDPSQGRRIASLIEQIASARQAVPPARFTTGRGSSYVQLPDATTVRYKARRPEHFDDFGWMARSDGTAFVSPSDADLLSLVQAQGPRKFMLLQDPAQSLLAVGYRDARRPLRGTVVHYRPSPQEGLMPLEMWNDNSQHFGNVITSMAPEPNWADWLERYMRQAPPPGM